MTCIGGSNQGWGVTQALTRQGCKEGRTSLHMREQVQWSGSTMTV